MNGIEAGDAVQLARQAAQRQAVQARLDRRAAESAERVRNNMPQTAEEARRAQEYLLEQQVMLVDTQRTRGDTVRVTENAARITAGPGVIRSLRAKEREKQMWNPASFHRSHPSTLHRTPDRAQLDPPPRLTQAFCYVPRIEASRAGYVQMQNADPNAPEHPSAGKVRVFVMPDDTDPYDRNEGHPVPIPYDDSMRQTVRRMQSLASSGNVTWFTAQEKDNPIHFWEQWVRCYHCGRDHFLPALSAMHASVGGMHIRCCKEGECVLDKDHSLPDSLLNVIAYGTGCSSASRSMNEVRRLCAQALPMGTQRHVEAGGGARITGIPYAVVTNIKERCAARMFLEDPTGRANRYDSVAEEAWVRPRCMRVFNYALDSNPLFGKLTEWHNQSFGDVHLGLKWEGTTNAIRMFTVTPSTAHVYERTVLIMSRSEVDQRKYIIKATNQLYPCVNWPLAFPHGTPPLLADGAPLDDWLRIGGRQDRRDINLQKATCYT